MKRLFYILLIVLAFTSCERTPETGSLLIRVEYDGFLEENAEVSLYNSRETFDRFEYFDIQISDENGEVFWGGLEPGWYYFKAELSKSSMFNLYAVDSTEVFVNEQRNKRLILSPE
jgi:hypothetical protein